jgi:hypothetical protein
MNHAFKRISYPGHLVAAGYLHGAGEITLGDVTGCRGQLFERTGHPAGGQRDDDHQRAP